MKTAVAALILFTCLSASAQEIVWEKIFTDSIGFQQGVDVIQTEDGCFLAVARTGSGRGSLATTYLVRTDGDGAPLWQKALAGLGSTYAVALHHASDGAFFLFGSTRTSSSSGDTLWSSWCAKLDGRGEVLREKDYGPGRIINAEPVAGGYILTGESGAELLLMKLTDDGEILWRRTIAKGVSAVGGSVRQTADGGFIVVGSTVARAGGDTDVLLVRTTAKGEVLFNNAYETGPGMWENGYCVEETLWGGFIFAAANKGNASKPGSFGRLFLQGVDANGLYQWDRLIPIFVRGTDSLGVNQPRMSRRLPDGEIVIAGASGPDVTMPFLIQIRNEGAVEWKKLLGDLIFSQSVAAAFRPLPDGGFIVVGTKTQHILLTRLARFMSAVEKDRPLPAKLDLSGLGPIGR